MSFLIRKISVNLTNQIRQISSNRVIQYGVPSIDHEEIALDKCTLFRSKSLPPRRALPFPFSYETEVRDKFAKTNQDLMTQVIGAQIKRNLSQFVQPPTYKTHQSRRNYSFMDRFIKTKSLPQPIQCDIIESQSGPTYKCKPIEPQENEDYTEILLEPEKYVKNKPETIDTLKCESTHLDVIPVLPPKIIWKHPPLRTHPKEELPLCDFGRMFELSEMEAKLIQPTDYQEATTSIHMQEKNQLDSCPSCNPTNYAANTICTYPPRGQGVDNSGNNSACEDASANKTNCVAYQAEANESQEESPILDSIDNACVITSNLDNPYEPPAEAFLEELFVTKSPNCIRTDEFFNDLPIGNAQTGVLSISGVQGCRGVHSNSKKGQTPKDIRTAEAISGVKISYPLDYAVKSEPAAPKKTMASKIPKAKPLPLIGTGIDAHNKQLKNLKVGAKKVNVSYNPATAKMPGAMKRKKPNTADILNEYAKSHSKRIHGENIYKPFESEETPLSGAAGTFKASQMEQNSSNEIFYQPNIAALETSLYKKPEHLGWKASPSWMEHTQAWQHAANMKKSVLNTEKAVDVSFEDEHGCDEHLNAAQLQESQEVYDNLERRLFSVNPKELPDNEFTNAIPSYYKRRNCASKRIRTCDYSCAFSNHHGADSGIHVIRSSSAKQFNKYKEAKQAHDKVFEPTEPTLPKYEEDIQITEPGEASPIKEFLKQQDQRHQRNSQGRMEVNDLRAQVLKNEEDVQSASSKNIDRLTNGFNFGTNMSLVHWTSALRAKRLTEAKAKEAAQFAEVKNAAKPPKAKGINLGGKDVSLIHWTSAMRAKQLTEAKSKAAATKSGDNPITQLKGTASCNRLTYPELVRKFFNNILDRCVHKPDVSEEGKSAGWNKREFSTLSRTRRQRTTRLKPGNVPYLSVIRKYVRNEHIIPSQLLDSMSNYTTYQTSVARQSKRNFMSGVNTTKPRTLMHHSINGKISRDITAQAENLANASQKLLTQAKNLVNFTQDALKHANALAIATQHGLSNEPLSNSRNLTNQIGKVKREFSTSSGKGGGKKDVNPKCVDDSKQGEVTKPHVPPVCEQKKSCCKVKEYDLQSDKKAGKPSAPPCQGKDPKCKVKHYGEIIKDVYSRQAAGENVNLVDRTPPGFMKTQSPQKPPEPEPCAPQQSKRPKKPDEQIARWSAELNKSNKTPAQHPSFKRNANDEKQGALIPPFVPPVCEPKKVCCKKHMYDLQANPKPNKKFPDNPCNTEDSCCKSLDYSSVRKEAYERKVPPQRGGTSTNPQSEESQNEAKRIAQIAAYAKSREPKIVTKRIDPIISSDPEADARQGGLNAKFVPPVCCPQSTCCKKPLYDLMPDAKPDKKYPDPPCDSEDNCCKAIDYAAVRKEAYDKKNPPRKVPSRIVNQDVECPSEDKKNAKAPSPPNPCNVSSAPKKLVSSDPSADTRQGAVVPKFVPPVCSPMKNCCTKQVYDLKPDPKPDEEYPVTPCSRDDNCCKAVDYAAVRKGNYDRKVPPIKPPASKQAAKQQCCPETKKTERPQAPSFDRSPRAPPWKPVKEVDAAADARQGALVAKFVPPVCCPKPTCCKKPLYDLIPDPKPDKKYPDNPCNTEENCCKPLEYSNMRKEAYERKVPPRKVTPRTVVQELETDKIKKTKKPCIPSHQAKPAEKIEKIQESTSAPQRKVEPVKIVDRAADASQGAVIPKFNPPVCSPTINCCTKPIYDVMPDGKPAKKYPDIPCKAEVSCCKPLEYSNMRKEAYERKVPPSKFIQSTTAVPQETAPKTQDFVKSLGLPKKPKDNKVCEDKEISQSEIKAKVKEASAKIRELLKTKLQFPEKPESKYRSNLSAQTLNTKAELFQMEVKLSRKNRAKEEKNNAARKEREAIRLAFIPPSKSPMASSARDLNRKAKHIEQEAKKMELELRKLEKQEARKREQLAQQEPKKIPKFPDILRQNDLCLGTEKTKAPVICKDEHDDDDPKCGPSSSTRPKETKTPGDKSGDYNLGSKGGDGFEASAKHLIGAKITEITNKLIDMLEKEQAKQLAKDAQYGKLGFIQNKLIPNLDLSNGLQINEATPKVETTQKVEATVAQKDDAIAAPPQLRNAALEATKAKLLEAKANKAKAKAAESRAIKSILAKAARARELAAKAAEIKSLEAKAFQNMVEADAKCAHVEVVEAKQQPAVECESFADIKILPPKKEPIMEDPILMSHKIKITQPKKVMQGKVEKRIAKKVLKKFPILSKEDQLVDDSIPVCTQLGMDIVNEWVTNCEKDFRINKLSIYNNPHSELGCSGNDDITKVLADGKGKSVAFPWNIIENCKHMIEGSNKRGYRCNSMPSPVIAPVCDPILETSTEQKDPIVIINVSEPESQKNEISDPYTGIDMIDEPLAMNNSLKICSKRKGCSGCDVADFKRAENCPCVEPDPCESPPKAVDEGALKDEFPQKNYEPKPDPVACPKPINCVMCNLPDPCPCPPEPEPPNCCKPVEVCCIPKCPKPKNITHGFPKHITECPEPAPPAKCMKVACDLEKPDGTAGDVCSTRCFRSESGRGLKRRIPKSKDDEATSSDVSRHYQCNFDPPAPPKPAKKCVKAKPPMIHSTWFPTPIKGDSKGFYRTPPKSKSSPSLASPCYKKASNTQLLPGCSKYPSVRLDTPLPVIKVEKKNFLEGTKGLLRNICVAIMPGKKSNGPKKAIGLTSFASLPDLYFASTANSEPMATSGADDASSDGKTCELPEVNATDDGDESVQNKKKDSN